MIASSPSPGGKGIVRTDDGGSPMTTDDVIELYVMREVLEGLASRLAARR